MDSSLLPRPADHQRELAPPRRARPPILDGKRLDRLELTSDPERRMWIVSAHQRRRRRVTEVSGLNPVHRCSGLASRWRACGYGLEGQEISDADKPQYLPFHRADAAAGLVVIQAR
jgi:hypothetical protein